MDTVNDGDWRTSSHSGTNGDCVEIASWRKSSYGGTNGGDCVGIATWRKSSHSGTSGGDCVEVGDAARAVLVRDTKDRAGGALAFTANAWDVFTASLKQ